MHNYRCCFLNMHHLRKTSARQVAPLATIPKAAKPHCFYNEHAVLCLSGRPPHYMDVRDLSKCTTIVWTYVFNMPRLHEMQGVARLEQPKSTISVAFTMKMTCFACPHCIDARDLSKMHNYRWIFFKYAPPARDERGPGCTARDYT